MPKADTLKTVADVLYEKKADKLGSAFSDKI
ncbi:MAG: hypothetical protein KatS3mg101_0431 [Patescibacteria group bacterium]|nr:MAG: hypothetical protein KatS3mg101_0431 [Patescibacteria group bacterium]